MKPFVTDTGDRQPRMVAERKPLRPVQTAAVRAPIKVTKPILLAQDAHEAPSPGLRPAR